MNCETMGGNLGFVQIACRILLDSFGSMAITVGLLSIGRLFFFRMLYAQYGLIGLKFFP